MVTPAHINAKLPELVMAKLPDFENPGFVSLHLLMHKLIVLIGHAHRIIDIRIEFIIRIIRLRVKSNSVFMRKLARLLDFLVKLEKLVCKPLVKS